MFDATLPIQPAADESRPAPSVSITNITNTYAFGAFLLTVEINEQTLSKTDVTLLIENENGDPMIGTIIAARAWFVDGDLDPANNPDDVFKISITAPADLPGGSMKNIAFIDGEANFILENSASSGSWYVLIEINSYVSVLGPYTIGI